MAMLLRYRADWSDQECHEWKQEAPLTWDGKTLVPTIGLLSLSCAIKTETDGTEVAFVWYPPTTPPGGDRFFGRPTTVGAYRMLTMGTSAEQWPKWSRTRPGDGRHGTYLRYYPDKDRAAFWLEQSDDPVALILFGPPGAGDVFAQLQAILERHGYHLD